jgi:hypothetical protein
MIWNTWNLRIVLRSGYYNHPTDAQHLLSPVAHVVHKVHNGWLVAQYGPLWAGETLCQWRHLRHLIKCRIPVSMNVDKYLCTHAQDTYCMVINIIDAHVHEILCKFIEINTSHQWEVSWMPLVQCLYLVSIHLNEFPCMRAQITFQLWLMYLMHNEQIII